MKLIFRARKDVKALGKIMGIWAHPDDESFTMAGLMAAAAANGQGVCCVTATRGEAGVYDEKRWPAATIGRTRQKELEGALKTLGVKDHYWLGYIDGRCQKVKLKAAAAKLVPIIEAVQPDSVITFGPQGSTGHPDHIAVSNWTGEALAAARLKKRPELYHVADSKESYQRVGRRLDAKFNIFFNLDQPPLVSEADMDLRFYLPDDLLDKKIAALKAQASQTAPMFADNWEKDLREWLKLEGFVLGTG